METNMNALTVFGSRRRYGVIDILVITAILMVLASIVLRAVDRAREPAPKSESVTEIL